MADESEDTGKLEALVAECIERAAQEGPLAVERVCAQHPEFAPRVRERLEALRRLGFAIDELAEATPQRFGRFTILRELGRGGMGVVYLAHDPSRNIHVALKTGFESWATDDRRRERFQREVRAATQLDHPRVVPIIDVGAEEGVPFFTMRHVEGATLSELLAKLKAAPPRWEELTPAALAGSRLNDSDAARSAPAHWGQTYVEAAARIVLDVAQALSHVHSRGIVHRDVKPANVLIDRAGRGNLFDLGLAHLDDAYALTRTGDLAGSPMYMSPEQVSGSPSALDARSDVYSLGVTLFELLTLRLPFEAANTPQLLRQIQQREPPLPRSISPLVPRDLETICLTALEKDPDHRYASAAELAEDLERFLGFQAVRARAAGPLRRLARAARRNPALASAFGLGAAVLIATPVLLYLHDRRVSTQNRLYRAAAAEATREAEENREVSSFLERLFLDLERRGSADQRALAHQILVQGTTQTVDQLGVSAATRANLLETVARVYIGMGSVDQAVPLLDRSLAIRQREQGEAHVETAGVLRHLASAHLAAGELGLAQALCDRSRRAFAAAGHADHEAAAELWTLEGQIAFARGDAAAARRCLEVALEHQPDGHAQRGLTLRLLGEVLFQLDVKDRAAELLNESLSVAMARPTPRLNDVADGLVGLARFYGRSGSADAALGLWRQAIDVHRKSHGDMHPAVGRVLETFARDGGRLEPPPEEALDWARTWHLLARHRAAAGHGQALAAFDRALALLERRPASAQSPEERDLLAELTTDSAAELRLAGRFDAAYERVARLQQRRPLDAHAASAWMARAQRELFLGVLATYPGRAAAEAARVTSWYRRALANLPPELGDTFQVTLREQALDLVRAGFQAEARSLYERALELDLLRAGGPALRSAAEPGEPEVPFATRFDELFRSGIGALQSGHHTDAADAFQACLELRPEHATAAYNLACARSLAGQVERGLDALERASASGWGFRADGLELAATDADLAALRSHPRFKPILDRMARLRERAEAYASAPGLYLPPGLEGAEVLPLLVVLHANGATKSEILSGPWRELADRHSIALLAPSGRIPVVADQPERGMRWSESVERYRERSWYYESKVNEAVHRFRRERAVDPQRIYIAGHGQGGTLAFNIALHAPDVYRGAILIDATIAEDLARDQAQHVGSLGLRVALLNSATRLNATGDLARYLSSLFDTLRQWGIQTTIGTYVGELAGERLDQALAELVNG